MGSFKFNKTLYINIEDNTYSIDVTSKVIVEAVLEITNRSLALNQKEHDSLTVEELQAQVEELKDITVKFITTCLGKEAFNSLFDGKVIEYADLVDLAEFILKEITKFKQDRYNEFIAKKVN